MACAYHDIEQQVIADKIGMNKGDFSRIISGNTKQSKHFTAIAKALNCSVEWLVDGADPQPAWMTVGVSNNQPDLSALARKVDELMGELARLRAFIAPPSSPEPSFTFPAPANVAQLP